MVLKSLILQGFKSFPDRTEIKFLGGITAIVGPNGSGKSNISDAIRWVLGEQSSRSLRGAKMEDVIFGGTARRGPVGFAEVSLILDNSAHVFRSEFIEIMVTRRYYRSGESEYFLNKKHCRLKDVHELFMDTGLGRDGYSSIGQGRIDEILSFKSEDGAKSSRKPQASPSSATVRKKPSAGCQPPRKIWCVSATCTANWKTGSSRSSSRLTRRKGFCICGMSCVYLRSRCGCCRSSSSRMTLPS